MVSFGFLFWSPPKGEIENLQLDYIIMLSLIESDVKPKTNHSVRL